MCPCTGTHVAGTIAAPRNGVGVVGVVPGGAELHIVRVWNNSGDVSQGQGPFATDLLLAYDACLARLLAVQRTKPATKLVINMSYGSPGPLTAERMWVHRAAARGDVLMVAAAGNNGSYLPPPGVKSQQQPQHGSASEDDNSDDDAPAKQQQASLREGQYLSYPASHDVPEMLSVASARCDGSIEVFSQKNVAVDIAAPGTAVLSSVPRAAAAVRGHVATSVPLSPQREPALDGQGVPAVRRGLALLSSGHREPRPIRGSRLGSSGMLPLVSCTAGGGAGTPAVAAPLPSQAQAPTPSASPPPRPSPSLVAATASCTSPPGGGVCIVQLPGAAAWGVEACTAMLACVRGGGRGLVVYRAPPAAGSDDVAALNGFSQYADVLPPTQLDCGPACASCSTALAAALRGAQPPPGVVASPALGTALAALASAGGAANVTVYEYAYRHWDGTSMAAPAVSGAAAALWSRAPACTAGDIAAALRQGAMPLPGQSPLATGAGMLRVDGAMAWLRRNKRCAAR